MEPRDCPTFSVPSEVTGQDSAGESTAGTGKATIRDGPSRSNKTEQLVLAEPFYSSAASPGGR
jgi:hypothetical protein